MKTWIIMQKICPVCIAVRRSFFAFTKVININSILLFFSNIIKDEFLFEFPSSTFLHLVIDLQMYKIHVLCMLWGWKLLVKSWNWRYSSRAFYHMIQSIRRLLPLFRPCYLRPHKNRFKKRTVKQFLQKTIK